MPIDKHLPVIMIGPQEFDYKNILIEEPSNIIWVDGGRNHFKSLSDYEHQTTHTIIGDGDSIEKDFIDIEHKLSTNKDFSDLAYALTLLKGVSKTIHSWGFLGGRLDHQMANFGEVTAFLQHKQELMFTWDQKVFSLAPGQYHFSFQGGFSLLSLMQSTVTLQGEVQYPMTTPKTLQPCQSFGLSNLAFGDFRIDVENYPCHLFLINSELSN